MSGWSGPAPTAAMYTVERSADCLQRMAADREKSPLSAAKGATRRAPHGLGSALAEFRQIRDQRAAVTGDAGDGHENLHAA